MSQFPVTITGHLTHDPRVIRVKEGLIKTIIRVASSRRVLDQREDANEPTWRDADLLYIDIETWGDFAANVAQSLRRGMPVIVSGSLMTNQWEDEKGPQTKIMMRANWLGLDLNRYKIASERTDTVYNAAGVEGLRSTNPQDDIPVDIDHTADAPAGDPAEDAGVENAGNAGDEADAGGAPTFEERKRHESSRAGLGLGAGKPNPGAMPGAKGRGNERSSADAQAAGKPAEKEKVMA